MSNTPQGPSLIDDVRAALIKRRGKYREIAKITGFSYCWIHKFSKGAFPNASYSRLKKLAELFASGTI